MRKTSSLIAGGFLAATLLSGCKLPQAVGRQENRSTPARYSDTLVADTLNSATLPPTAFFTDPYLVALIDTALRYNQEINIVQQEIAITRNEIRIRQGDFLPSVRLRGSAAVDKRARYTNIGALERNIEIKPGVETPEPLPDFLIAAQATWEVDIWRKLRNARQSAIKRYLASQEGRNFAITNLIAEVANSYYELLALDNQLAILEQNIGIQTTALGIVRLQKEAARVTELAVKRFEAEVAKTQSLQYDIRQRITETENRINFLLGRFAQSIPRDPAAFNTAIPAAAQPGIPSQLLANRADVRRAEQQLAASRLDVKVARAQFYPSLGINAAVGFQAFNPAYLVSAPESILANLAGDLVAPIINRNAIKALYLTANAQQVQAAYNYERSILNGYVEVANQLSRIQNLGRSYELKTQQVAALNRSVSISNDLFKSARADYVEVLLTQREALESKFDLVEVRMQQMQAVVGAYQALGGGWR